MWYIAVMFISGMAYIFLVPNVHPKQITRRKQELY